MYLLIVSSIFNKQLQLETDENIYQKDKKRKISFEMFVRINSTMLVTSPAPPPFLAFSEKLVKNGSYKKFSNNALNYKTTNFCENLLLYSVANLIQKILDFFVYFTVFLRF